MNTLNTYFSENSQKVTLSLGKEQEGYEIDYIRKVDDLAQRSVWQKIKDWLGSGKREWIEVSIKNPENEEESTHCYLRVRKTSLQKGLMQPASGFKHEGGAITENALLTRVQELHNEEQNLKFFPERKEFLLSLNKLKAAANSDVEPGIRCQIPLATLIGQRFKSPVLEKFREKIVEGYKGVDLYYFNEPDNLEALKERIDNVLVRLGEGEEKKPPKQPKIKPKRKVTFQDEESSKGKEKADKKEKESDNKKLQESQEVKAEKIDSPSVPKVLRATLELKPEVNCLEESEMNPKSLGLGLPILGNQFIKFGDFQDCTGEHIPILSTDFYVPIAYEDSDAYRYLLEQSNGAFFTYNPINKETYRGPVYIPSSVLKNPYTGKFIEYGEEIDFTLNGVPLSLTFERPKGKELSLRKELKKGQRIAIRNAFIKEALWQCCWDADKNPKFNRYILGKPFYDLETTVVVTPAKKTAQPLYSEEDLEVFAAQFENCSIIPNFQHKVTHDSMKLFAAIDEQPDLETVQFSLNHHGALLSVQIGSERRGGVIESPDFRRITAYGSPYNFSGATVTYSPSSGEYEYGTSPGWLTITIPKKT